MMDQKSVSLAAWNSVRVPVSTWSTADMVLSPQPTNQPEVSRPRQQSDSSDSAHNQKCFFFTLPLARPGK